MHARAYNDRLDGSTKRKLILPTMEMPVLLISMILAFSKLGHEGAARSMSLWGRDLALDLRVSNDMG